MASGGEQCLAEFIAFGIIGVVGAVGSWLWAAGKRAVKGTPLSKNQQDELKQFKKDQTEGKQE